MKRRLIAVACLVFATQGSNAQVQPHCNLDNVLGGILPMNWRPELGPAAYQSIVGNSGDAEAITAARMAWNDTDANGRIGDWNGVVSTSDCPRGQHFQIGLYSFTSSTCPTLAAYGITGVKAQNTLAFVDYSAACINCQGLRSISVNMNYAFSVSGTPLPNEYDLQSLFAHEFGHVLSLAHMYNGICYPALIS